MWRGAYVLTIACATLFTISVQRANAQSDPGTDPDAVCNGKPLSNPDDLYQERLAAVFAVQVTGAEGKSRRTGTATLIDQGGIFLTAAHVVHFNEKWPITVSQKFTGQVGHTIERRYRVKVMTNTDDWQKQDGCCCKPCPKNGTRRGLRQSRCASMPCAGPSGDFSLAMPRIWTKLCTNNSPLHLTILRQSTEELFFRMQVVRCCSTGMDEHSRWWCATTSRETSA
jgi:hypothetical protein